MICYCACLFFILLFTHIHIYKRCLCFVVKLITIGGVHTCMLHKIPTIKYSVEIGWRTLPCACETRPVRQNFFFFFHLFYEPTNTSTRVNIYILFFFLLSFFFNSFRSSFIIPFDHDVIIQRRFETSIFQRWL